MFVFKFRQVSSGCEYLHGDSLMFPGARLVEIRLLDPTSRPHVIRAVRRLNGSYS